ncbi:MAG: MmcQ/YjbR family DNA-binding protein [Pseudomonadota bacterium]
MNYANAKAYLLSKPEAAEDYPFGAEAAVFKIRGKMFALLIEVKGAASLNLKCDPDEALALRDIFPAITPGYHMNKKHWNTVQLDGTVPRGELERMIDNSFMLVIKGMPKTKRPLVTDN